MKLKKSGIPKKNLDKNDDLFTVYLEFVVGFFF
jgi:hypothetical protein